MPTHNPKIYIKSKCLQEVGQEETVRRELSFFIFLSGNAGAGKMNQETQNQEALIVDSNDLIDGMDEPDDPIRWDLKIIKQTKCRGNQTDQILSN